MLIKIIIENFKSFDKRTELTMISSSKIRTKQTHRVKLGCNTNLLKYAVIYGANASGKSNLVDFMRFFKYMILHGIPIWGTKYFCCTTENNQERDSIFELQMEIDGKFYAYGFSALLAESAITGEWLYELYQNGNSRCIYERKRLLKPTLDSSVALTREERLRFDTYASDFEKNQSDLFLTEMNRGKSFSEKSALSVFKKVFEWLNKHIVIITPDAPVTDFRYYYEEDSLELINEMISTFDTGISDVRIEEIDMGELSRMLPKSILRDVLNTIRQNFSDTPQKHYRLSGRSGKNFFNIEINGKEDPRITTIKLHHGTSAYDFSFEDESDGTIRLFDLMDMLLTQGEDIVYIVDELERSLHPKLTEHFLNLFDRSHQEEKAQLIFTTHEASIMEQNLFRRDEIWFLERNTRNNSELYSLDTFKERYDKKLSKAYLDGRYGAIPIFK